MSTRSAAVRAAGDSAPATPTPTSASRIAAASFTPSPVIASVAPARRSAATSATFCSGERRAKTAASRTMRVRSASEARANCGPGDHAVGVGDAGLRSDGGRGLGVVAGGDDDPHAGGAELLDGGDRRLPDGVGQRDEAAECQVAVCLASRSSGRPSHLPVGDGEHPQPLPRQLLHLSTQVVVGGAPAQHDLGRALDHQSAVAQRRGEPSAGGEGQARVGVAVRHHVALAGGLDDGPVGLVRLLVAVARRPPRRGAAAPSSSRSSDPSGTSRATRSRFSVRVPVLSKQTVSTRPSASSTRALRTTAPRRDSRRAAACCATVATSGSPSGTAATATARPGADRLAQRPAARARRAR